MIDNADAFVASSELAEAGGRAVFEHLLFLAQVSRPHEWTETGVHTVLAGSPMLHTRDELRLPWLRGTRYRDRSDTLTRWNIYQLGDPSSETAVTALQSAGHSLTTAQSIVSRLGTRYDSLEGFMKHSVATDAQRMEELVQRALCPALLCVNCALTRQSLSGNVAEPNEKGRAALRAALGDAAGNGSATPARKTAFPTTIPFYLRAPAAVELLRKEILYIDVDGTVRFANKPCLDQYLAGSS